MTSTATVRRIRDEVKARFDAEFGDVGDAFTLVALEHFFELDEDQAREACVAGVGDRGIDAYFNDEVEQQIVVAQSKWTNRAKTFGPEVVQSLEDVWGMLDQIAGQAHPRGRDEVVAAARQIRDLRGRDSSYPVGLYFFSTGSFSGAALDQADAFNDRHVEDNVVMYLVGIDEIAEAYEQNQSRLREEPIGRIRLALEESFEFAPYDNQPKTIVGAINCLQLATIERRFRYRIFQRNVRFFLTARRRENQGIKQTLGVPGGTKGRSRFWFFNNGISIVCDSISRPDPDTNDFVIENLQIVNGCQTTTTLGENIRELGDPDEAAYVLIRIVAAPDEDLQSLISVYNNRQNAVNDRDLQSNDDVQSRLQEDFGLLEPAWFYEKKRGEWEARFKDHPQLKARFESETAVRRINNEKAAQAAYAFHLEPAVARARKKYLFVKHVDDAEKGLYEHVFNEHTTPEWLLLPYLLSEYVVARRNEFMLSFKSAQLAARQSVDEGRLVTADVQEILQQEWMKFADQYILGAMGFYLRRRLELDHSTIVKLLDESIFDRIAALTYEQARADFIYYFLRKQSDYSERSATFVAANWVKGNWQDARTLLSSEETLRERTHRSVFGELVDLVGG